MADADESSPDGNAAAADPTTQRPLKSAYAQLLPKLTPATKKLRMARDRDYKFFATPTETVLLQWDAMEGEWDFFSAVPKQATLTRDKALRVIDRLMARKKPSRSNGRHSPRVRASAKATGAAAKREQEHAPLVRAMVQAKHRVREDVHLLQQNLHRIAAANKRMEENAAAAAVAAHAAHEEARAQRERERALELERQHRVARAREERAAQLHQEPLQHAADGSASPGRRFERSLSSENLAVLLELTDSRVPRHMGDGFVGEDVNDDNYDGADSSDDGATRARRWTARRVGGSRSKHNGDSNDDEGGNDEGDNHRNGRTGAAATTGGAKRRLSVERRRGRMMVAVVVKRKEPAAIARGRMMQQKLKPRPQERARARWHGRARSDSGARSVDGRRRRGGGRSGGSVGDEQHGRSSSGGAVDDHPLHHQRGGGGGGGFPALSPQHKPSAQEVARAPLSPPRPGALPQRCTAPPTTQGSGSGSSNDADGARADGADGVAAPSHHHHHHLGRDHHHHSCRRPATSPSTMSSQPECSHHDHLHNNGGDSLLPATLPRRRAATAHARGRRPLLRSTASFTKSERPAVGGEPSSYFSKGVYSRVSIHGMPTLQDAIWPQNDLGSSSISSGGGGGGGGGGENAQQQQQQQPQAPQQHDLQKPEQRDQEREPHLGSPPGHGAHGAQPGSSEQRDDSGGGGGRGQTARLRQWSGPRHAKKSSASSLPLSSSSASPAKHCFGVRVTKKSAFRKKEPVVDAIRRERRLRTVASAPSLTTVTTGGVAAQGRRRGRRHH